MQRAELAVSPQPNGFPAGFSKLLASEGLMADLGFVQLISLNHPQPDGAQTPSLRRGCWAVSRSTW